MKKAQPADFPKFEAEVLAAWDKEDTFNRSVENRRGSKRFRFYDGPPFPSGEPHYGHIEQGALKDAVARYKTMRGFYSPRRTGWDTHGLPVEFLVEKEMGFKTKQDIVNYGIDKFNEACRRIVFRYRDDFNRTYHRMGRWANPDEAYATLDDNYMESVWWVFSEIYKKGLVYQGFKSLPYCPRCATPLSNFEVNDGYKDNVPDPSLYVAFKLKDDDASMLAWTTTPWSLPGNAALAVNPKAAYVRVVLTDDDGQSRELILAETRLESLAYEYEVKQKMKGTELVGLSYEPLFQLDNLPQNDDLYKVWPADFVSIEDGTGVLHVAPAFGEDDLNLGLKHKLPVLSTVDSNGKLTSDINLKEVHGVFFKKADDVITQYLTKTGHVLLAETKPHTYPFCWRCETPLLYYAITTWFVNVTKIKPDMVEAGEQTNWIPGHIKQGRFIKWLEGARDWAISRNRFWGAPIPVWQCAEGHNTVIASVAELHERAVGEVKLKDLHKPGIDEVVIKCSECGAEAHRIEEVFDCWFESGSMPYGQDHYPFENKQEFEESNPADFIVEALEQVHLWFYTLHVLGVALFKKPTYKNIIASGLVMAADGRKLSKRLRNYPPVEELFNDFGADSLRFFLLSSPLMYGEPARLSRDAIADIQRNVFLRLWNVYSFFTTYAEIDGWQPAAKLEQPESDNLLDQWLLARLNQVTAEMTKQADDYQIARAVRPLAELVDDLSNWYVRRSRRRFWKSEDDQDKEQAYAVLHYVLARIAQLLAPWSPFIADKLWRELTEGMEVADSVHLSDWPEAGKVDDALLHEMSLARNIVTDALAVRAEAKIKVRQPLSELTVFTLEELPENLRDVIAEEVNVKKVTLDRSKKNKGYELELDTKLSESLKNEGLARDFIRAIQVARKAASFNVDDRITLYWEAEGSDLPSAVSEFNDLIKQETLTVEMPDQEMEGAFTTEAKVAGQMIKLALKKA